MSKGEIRIVCRWCDRPAFSGCGCEASVETARLRREREEARSLLIDALSSEKALRLRAERAEADYERAVEGMTDLRRGWDALREALENVLAACHDRDTARAQAICEEALDR